MTTIDPGRIDANWRAVQIELDAPRPGRVERLLRRVGLPDTLTRLLVATPSLRRAWFGSLALVIVVGLGAADAGDPRQGLFTMLLLAPLVPVLGVALAYGPGADPAHEIALASPMRGVRLLLVRTAMVVGLALAALGAATLLAPEPSWFALGWLLPALASTSTALALCTYMAPRRAGWVTAISWVALVVVAAGAGNDRLTAFAPGGQAVAVAVAVVGVAVLTVRRDRLDVLEASS